MEQPMRSDYELYQLHTCYAFECPQEKNIHLVNLYCFKRDPRSRVIWEYAVLAESVGGEMISAHGRQCLWDQVSKELNVPVDVILKLEHSPLHHACKFWMTIRPEYCHEYFETKAKPESIIDLLGRESMELIQSQWASKPTLFADP